MGDPPRSHFQDSLHVSGLGSICKACKSWISKCYPERHFSFSKKSGNKSKTRPIEENSKISRLKTHKSTKKDVSVNKIHHTRRGSLDANVPTSRPEWIPQVSPLSRSTSMRSQTLVQPPKSLSTDGSSLTAFQRALSRSTSRTGSTRIVFSNSTGLMKPAATEQQLECTLQELCFGCIKKVNITRDVVTDNGEIAEEDEVLTIIVQPGWKKGTMITFEGKGNEMPGIEPADVIYVVQEKKHPLFRRKEDDLELEVEILLVDALTGCTLTVPLLGGQTKRLTFDDILHPGYQKIITGQGMPKQKEPGRRGNLIITISVKFPKELTEGQRRIAADILNQPC
ncbi:hypothetical protein ACS0TY_012916 [Phlomoides rotata]